METGVSVLVSILIPAYNAEQWIRDTIQSAQNQTWPRKEIIIVDDNSTDNTLRVADQFASKTVKVTTQENSGASAARNRALSLAQGDYIQWLDADDLLAPDKIEVQLRHSGADRNSKILLSSAWAKFYFRPEKAVFTTHSLWQDLPPLEWLLIKFQESIWQHPATWLVSRRLTELSCRWDERLSLDDDGEYFCRVVAASEKVAFVHEAKTFYRIGNSGSLSWGMSEKACDSLFLATALCIRHLRSLEDSCRTNAASIALLQDRIGYFYPENGEFVKKMNDLCRELGGGELAPRESRRFALVRRITGWNAAKKIKTLVWRAEMATLKNWDRMLYVLFDR